MLKKSKELDMTWYDAQFSDGQRTYTVGPFDSANEAETFGQARHGDQLDYLGVAQRVGRQEIDKLIGTLQLTNAPTRPNRHTGVITKWDAGATHGFITATDGMSWFASRDELPDGRMSLPLGTAVTFTGSPKPKPGKKYPQAYSIEADES